MRPFTLPPSSRPRRSIFLEQLGGGVGGFHFRRADVFDFHRCVAVNVHVVAIKAHGTFHLEFKLGEDAVLDPEFYRAGGIGDGGAVGAAAAAAEHEQRLGAVFGRWNTRRRPA